MPSIRELEDFCMRHHKRIIIGKTYSKNKMLSVVTGYAHEESFYEASDFGSKKWCPKCRKYVVPKWSGVANDKCTAITGYCPHCRSFVGEANV